MVNAIEVPVSFKVCGCGREHDAASWSDLPLVGFMDLDADGDERLELRNCPCGSTVAVELPAEPARSAA